MRIYPVFFRILSSILGFHSLDARNIPLICTQIITTKNFSRQCQICPRGQKPSLVVNHCISVSYKSFRIVRCAPFSGSLLLIFIEFFPNCFLTDFKVYCFLNWSIIHLQCCFSSWCTTVWFINIWYMYFFQIPFHYSLLSWWWFSR